MKKTLPLCVLTIEIMKKLLILTLFLCFQGFSQVSFYVPVNTKHFVYSEKIPYVKGEGGNAGLLASYTVKNIIFGGGVMRNSYGYISRVAYIGVTRSINKISLSSVAGFADGYPHYGEENKHKGGGRILLLHTNKITPVLLLVIKIPIYKGFGTQSNISPVYVNTGLYLDINFKTKK